MSEHTPLSQTRSEGGNVVSTCHSHPVQRLPMGSLDMLHHHIAMDEVGADPGRVEAGPGSVQEHNTHYIIPYVPLLVHLNSKRWSEKRTQLTDGGL